MKRQKSLFLLSLSLLAVAHSLQANPKKRGYQEFQQHAAALTPEVQSQIARKRGLSVESDITEMEEQNLSPKNPPQGEVPEEALISTNREESLAALIESPQEENHENSAREVNILFSQGIPSLENLALESFLRVAAQHDVFSDGIHHMIIFRLADPYLQTMNELIEGLQKLSLKYPLYSMYQKDWSNKDMVAWMTFLRREMINCKKTIESNKYAEAFLQMYSTREVFPDFKKALELLQNSEKMKEEALQARQSNCKEREKLFCMRSSFFNHQARLVLKIAHEHARLIEKRVLRENSLLDVSNTQDNITSYKKQLALTAAFIKSQELFLRHIEKFSPEEKESISDAFKNAFKDLELLEEALRDHEALEAELLEARINMYDQMIKIFLSEDLRVNGLKGRILELHEKILFIISKRLTLRVEMARLNFMADGGYFISRSRRMRQAGEEQAPSSVLYKIPLSILVREDCLLKEIESDLLAGKKSLVVQKVSFFLSYEELAGIYREIINELYQNREVMTEVEFLEIHGDALSDLEEQEEVLADQEEEQKELFPGNQEIAILPWNFSKTFEENVAALPALK